MDIEALRRESTKTNFCHYTTIDNARNIINGCSIFFNKLKNMNDKEEFKIHEDMNDRIFVFSMCHSEAKDIPLFYLYSGIDGKGCRLEFTKSKIIEMLNGEIFPVNKSYRMLRKPYNHDEYRLLLGWIHYITKDGRESYRNKNIEKKYNSFSDALSSFSSDDEQYFVKRMYWKYEKEFRIVIIFKEPVSYDRVALKIPIKENEKSMFLKCGPEIDDKELFDIKTEFSGYGVGKVDRFGDIEIKMDLVNRNVQLLKSKS